MPTTLSLRTSSRAAEGGLARLNRALLGVVETIETWAARRAQRRDLLSLSDHLLHDIGHSRADAEAEATKRFWQA